MGIKNGRIAITLSPKGIDTIAFISSDKREALSFYSLIRDELNYFEEKVCQLCESTEGETNEKQR